MAHREESPHPGGFEAAAGSGGAQDVIQPGGPELAPDPDPGARKALAGV